MNAGIHVLFRIFLCVAFIASLYGGMTLLTALMFAKGHTVLAVVSGLILTSMTAMALGLISLAWSMVSDGETDEITELAPLPG